MVNAIELRAGQQRVKILGTNGVHELAREGNQLTQMFLRCLQARVAIRCYAHALSYRDEVVLRDIERLSEYIWTRDLRTPCSFPRTAMERGEVSYK